MNYSRVTYLVVFLVLSSTGGYAQIDTLGINQEGARADTAKPNFQVIPWKYNHHQFAEQVSNDSLLRWQIWPNWTYKKNRDPGAFSFRLGTVGRTSSVLIDAHEPRHQELYWEDISLGDPVSGMVNWNLLPQHKLRSVYENTGGIRHQTSFYLRQYYVNKPLTKLIFEESKFQYRNLEFFYTQNYSQKTNLELTYWYRTDGDEYPNSTFTGWQLFARMYHQLDNERMLKIQFLNNNIDLEQPFGYQIPNLQLFTFNRFTTTPVEPGADSKTTASTLALHFHKRKKDSVAVPENFRAGLFLNNRKRSLSYSADSTFYRVQSVGAELHKWWSYNPLTLEGTLSYERFFNKDHEQSNVTRSEWGLLKADAVATLSPIKSVDLSADASYRSRNDGSNAFQLGAGVKLSLFNRIGLQLHGAQGELMSTIQQLYWISNEFSADASLANEQISELDAQLNLKLFSRWNLGYRGQFKDIENAPMVGLDSVFTSVPSYQTLSSSVYVDYNGKHVEFSGSANIQQYRDVDLGPEPLADFSTERIWFKGAAYLKGYLFNRATYVKFGVAGMWSPSAYIPEHYNPVLDYWQPSSIDQRLPPFERMDVDLSARIRTLMIVLRMENVLNNVTQPGYFETAAYPMPRRRFIFGVRALFRN